ncbi:hypothetical protein KY336_02595 [Candidatus Woesearchaeota archaeon]|nr:hypothetical protein [Candidatus Woesearchaeota archaeon]
MQDKIINLVKLKGPVLPREISKDLGLDSLFTAAHLSEIVDQKKMKLSHAKIGGSPLYYILGQEEKLVRLVEYLNEKDRRAHDYLKEHKILRDKELNPLFQVAMRNIKDFAIPLKVNKTELFWKYFLVPDQEAIALIKEIIMAEQKPAEQPVVQQKPIVQPAPQPAPQPAAQAVPEPAQVTVKPEPVPEPKPEPQPAAVEVEEKSKPKAKAKPKAKPKKATVKKEKPAKQVPEKQKEIEEFKTNIEDIDDEFFSKIKAFCDEKKIKILDFDIIRKNKEIELKLLVPSIIGEVEYFAKAKSKKRSNDGDLSTAYIKGQSRNMPTLYLTPGEITKKAMEMVGKEFKQLIVKKLE